MRMHGQPEPNGNPERNGNANRNRCGLLSVARFLLPAKFDASLL
jgi:hypothetical protein